MSVVSGMLLKRSLAFGFAFVDRRLNSRLVDVELVFP